MNKSPNESNTAASPDQERLQKVLARAGLGSRRELEGWIEQGRISINGQVAELGARVGPNDVIRVDGKVVKHAGSKNQRRVLVYNKPEGEICSRKDPEGRATVFDHLPRISQGRWIAIGRLDYNTSGLLLFTTDGELAHAMSHPSAEIEREYLCRIMGEVDDEMRQRLLDGVMLEDGPARFHRVAEFGGDEGINRWFQVIVKEGRNREVRRLWESQGVQVSRLKRNRFGPIYLPPRLRAGTWEECDEKTVNALSNFLGLASRKATPLTPKEKHQMQRDKRKKPKSRVTRRKPRD